MTAGLEAAILGYLTAEADRFTCTVAAFNEELRQGGAPPLVLTSPVLTKAWANNHDDASAQPKDMDAAILAYLIAQNGGRQFVRTVAALTVELPPQHSGNDAPLVLEEVWAIARLDVDFSILMAAVEEGNLARVEYCVCVGVVLASPHEALHAAASRNNVAIMNILIACGHDKDAANGWGMTTLYFAAQKGHIDAVTCLVEQGADKDKQDAEGCTPLLIAVWKGHFTVVQYLVEQGADKEKTDNRRESPLYYAAEAGRFDIVTYLIEQGVNKEQTDNEACTPLMKACYGGHVHIVKYLLDQGCDRDHADNHGWTPLHSAAFNGHMDVAQLLFNYGVKLDARNTGGYLPTDLATNRGHHDFPDAVRAEEIRRRDHGFKRDRSTIPGTEEYEEAKRPRVETGAAVQEESEGGDDDDDDDDDDEDE